MSLEEYDDRVQEQNRTGQDIQKGNRDLLQQNHRLEAQIKALNDELMRTYCSRDVKSNFLDDALTQLQHTQDELTIAQNYVHHLKVELHERDAQLMVNQAQATELQDAVEHLQELLPSDEETEDEGSSGMEDD
jgi:chromosome segregation ATPase